MQKGSTKRLFVITSVCLLLFPTGNQGQEAGAVQLYLGAYLGSSYGWGNAFTWSHRPWISNKSDLGFHLGGILRYEFSSLFGLQLDVNYQSGAEEWIEHNWGQEEEFGEKDFSVFSISAEAVSHFYETQRIRIYILGGIGVSTGNLGDYGQLRGQYTNFIIGTGVKIKLKESKPRLALHLGGSYVRYHKPMTNYDNRIGIDFVRFLLGVEF